MGLVKEGTEQDNPSRRTGQETALLQEDQSKRIGPGRREIKRKLNNLIIDKLHFPDVPLTEVVQFLIEESRKQDSKNTGIHFMISRPANIAAEGRRPASEPPEAEVNFEEVHIHIDPPLRNVALRDVLDAITKTADAPIRYAIEEGRAESIGPKLTTRPESDFKIENNDA